MMPTPPYEIQTAFARRGPLRRYRLRQVATFTCLRCGGVHRARLVAVVEDDWLRLLCNNCYLAVVEQVADDDAADEHHAPDEGK